MNAVRMMWKGIREVIGNTGIAVFELTRFMESKA